MTDVSQLQKSEAKVVSPTVTSALDLVGKNAITKFEEFMQTYGEKLFIIY